MPGDADATRRRLLAAATEEFAEHGLAGGRVDRIAAAAKANKAQIYHYFGSKDRLFDAAFEVMVQDTIAAVAFDATDLADWAGRMFDSYERQPEMRRMAAWRRLERGAPHPPLDPIVQANHDQIAAIAEAQKAGYVSAYFAPVDVLAVLLALTFMWNSLTPELTAAVRGHSKTRRRKVVTDAVRSLLVGTATPASQRNRPRED
jgi:AcrR family transcriptional regulator